MCVGWVVAGGLGAVPECQGCDGESARAGEEGKVYCFAGKLGRWGGGEVVLVWEVEGCGCRKESQGSSTLMAPGVIAIEECEGEEG